MSIVYVASIIILFICAILIKKSKEKLDIVTTITLSVVILLAYNTFICYLFNAINIPINLYTLSIINIVISIGMIVGIKKIGIQEYKFNAKDLVWILIIVSIVITISYLNFGFPFKIKYLSTDASVHYEATYNFSQNETLLNKVEEGKTEMMPGAYTNAGIWFKIASPFIGEIDLYKVYISFDIFMLILAGILMFVTLKDNAKTKLERILAGIVSIIYLLGYPLNNMLFGYFYLPLAVIMINGIIIIMKYFEKELFSKWLHLALMFLLCFEVFFSYYLFVPVVYGAIGIYYMMFFYKKKHHIINKELILYAVVVLIIPCVLGFFYNILPGIKNLQQIKALDIMQMEGYIYRNLFSNILLFIPFFIYYLKKEKKLNFHIVFIILLIIYMCILYLGTKFGKISTYYFYKNYFVLWLLILYAFYKGMLYCVNTLKRGKIISITYIMVYISIFIISLIYGYVGINKSTKTYEKITDVMDIYGINKTILFDIIDDYNIEELKILNYIENNKIELKNKNTLIVGNQRQEFWFKSLLKYQMKDNLLYETTMQYIDLWNNDKYEYAILFYRSDYYKKYEKVINLEDKEVIFENESGAIIKNN